jgi:hypothetical protein
MQCLDCARPGEEQRSKWTVHADHHVSYLVWVCWKLFYACLVVAEEGYLKMLRVVVWALGNLHPSPHRTIKKHPLQSLFSTVDQYLSCTDSIEIDNKGTSWQVIFPSRMRFDGIMGYEAPSHPAGNASFICFFQGLLETHEARTSDGEQILNTMIGSCLDMASTTRSRLLAAFTCSLSADTHCLLAEKREIILKNELGLSQEGHLCVKCLLHQLLQAIVWDHDGRRQPLLQRPDQLRTAALLQHAPLQILYQRVDWVVMLP